MKNKIILAAVLAASAAHAAFVHPGCLSNASDITRMQQEIAAGAHPWIDAWNNLQASPFAASTWNPRPVADVVRGCSPTCTNNYTSCMQDAAAAYQNALEWVITGNTAYANCAVNILNQWQYTLTTIDPCCSDHFLLAGIQGYQFACAAELMRSYSGWAPSDFANFQQWMINVWYSVNNDFLTNHNGACVTHYWTNWDACNMASMIAIGVLCDNTTIFNQAVNYYKTGAGNGALAQAVYADFGPGLGQWEESGRDQGHTQLGLGLLGYMLEIAYKQGVDLYTYSANGKTYLDGMEYIAKYNSDTNTSVPFTKFMSCDSTETQTALSSTDRGLQTDRNYWDMLYSAFLREKKTMTYTPAMAAGLRPDHGGGYGSSSASWAFDHIGFSTLTAYLGPGSSSLPAAPTGVSASAGDAQVVLSWTGSSGSTSYTIERATVSGGPYTPVANVSGTRYRDNLLANGTSYYYVIAGENSAGPGSPSAQAAATPVASGTAPGAPTGLVASAASASAINLIWTAGSGAASYNVLEATTSGGPYTSIASQVTEPTFTQYGLTQGTTYYFVVQAVNSAGTSANSAQASAAPATVTWTDADIGSVTTAGNGVVSAGVSTVSGEGADIGGTADSFNSLYRTLNGDGTLTVRLAGVQFGSTANGKIGIDLRASTAAGAQSVALLVDYALGYSRLAYRSSSGGGTTWIQGPAGTALPLWLQLKRSGNTFTAAVSSDGVTWSGAGSVTVTLPTSILAGLAVCSRDKGYLDTATYDVAVMGP